MVLSISGSPSIHTKKIVQQQELFTQQVINGYVNSLDKSTYFQFTVQLPKTKNFRFDNDLATPSATFRVMAIFLHLGENLIREMVERGSAYKSHPPASFIIVWTLYLQISHINSYSSIYMFFAMPRSLGNFICSNLLKST